MNDPAAELGCDRAFRNGVDERPRPEDALGRMTPAQQRFGTDDRVVREPDLRLEIELKLVLLESAPQVGIEPAPGLRLRAKHGEEEAADAPAGGLRLIQREVGVGEQLIAAQAV